VRELDLLLHVADIDVVPFDVEQLMLARDAYERFGRRHHRAALNLGDCCAYALSRSSGEALLFKGDDFAHTDVPSALGPRPG
jgi:ribonuclease VapC